MRLKGFVAALLFTLVLAGSSGAVHAATSSGELVGQWTPDTSSNAQLTGHSFSISTTNESSARGAAGSFTPSFDQYCKSGGSGVGQATYYLLSYTWASTGTMGGCVSDKSKGHLYVWGSHNDVAYVRPVALKGEGILGGGWGLAGQGGNVNYEKLKAHHPAARFSAKVKSSSKKKGKKTVTTVSGTGALHIADSPTSCVASNVLSGTVPLSVRVTSGKSKLLDLKLGLGSPAGSYESCGSQSVLQSIPVYVKGSNRLQKVACKLNSTGTLSLTDKSGADALKLSIPACHLSLALSQTKKGSKVTVSVTYDANGY
jgi:hypothetical protein